MKIRTLILNLVALSFCAAPAHSIVVYTEDFETDGNGTRYTTSITEFNSTTSDHFGRTSGGAAIHVDDEGDNAYSGVNGSFFFAMEDADAGGGTLPGTWETTNPIFIAGSTTVSFSMLFAAGSSGSGTPSYEDDDFVRVFIDFDGAGTFATQLLGFETPLAAVSNQHIHQDTDFDNRGDGVQVTDALTTFTSATIASGGASTAKIRITFDASGTSEEFAFDNLMLDVDAVIPEPSTGILALLGCGLFLRRRRSA